MGMETPLEGETLVMQIERDLVSLRDRSESEEHLCSLENRVRDSQEGMFGRELSPEILQEAERNLLELQMRTTQRHIQELLGEMVECRWEGDYGASRASLAFRVPGIEISGYDSGLFASMSDGVSAVRDIEFLYEDTTQRNVTGLRCVVKRDELGYGAGDSPKGTSRIQVKITGIAFRIFEKVFSQDVSRIQRIRERIRL